MTEAQSTCQKCARFFTPTRRTQRFCTAGCRVAFWNEFAVKAIHDAPRPSAGILGSRSKDERKPLKRNA